MLKVIVTYNHANRPLGDSDDDIETREHFDDYYLKDLGNVLPAIVAEALHTPDTPSGHLTPEDIAVTFQPSGEFDRNVVDFSILILANDYTERRANLDERNDLIIERLENRVGSRTISVWTLLAHGAYNFSFEES